LPSANTPEFRFYVIESADLNAAALPDGTVLVNTGLLAALENEAQLAFVLGHEIAHVTQAHSWRQVHETRNKRIGLAIAGIAAAIAVGVMESNAGYYGPGPLSNLVDSLVTVGMAAIWNGYERKLENQAARLGLQALIDRGSRKSSSSGMGTARASPSGPTTSRASSAGAS
jgi:predicted Zn-dependent protease